jgi:DNA-binding LytR/AlgR family response regulator
MTIKCIIVDDEPLARKVIREYLEEIPEMEVKEEFSSALTALKYLREHSVDLIYLDINMPKLTGLQMVDQLEKLPLIIFTTAYAEYAVEAFEVKAFDYLVKPISFERFMKSCNRIIAELKDVKSANTHNSIVIKENKRYYKIDMSQIFYLKAFGDYVRIFTDEKTYITKERLTTMASTLTSDFMQVHRSFIINLDRVDYLEGNFVMVGGSQIPVSESYRTGLLNRLKIRY